MAYHRTAEQKGRDFAEARALEEHVASFLPEQRITKFDHNDDLDIWIPGYYVEVKAKRQKLTARWSKLVEIPERDLFIMDELSVRRACRHWPEAYFLIHDMPEDRYFLASVVDLVCVERTRVQRVGKGKWLVNLQDFYRVGRLEDLNELIQADLASVRWKQSKCLGAVPAPQV